MSCVLLTKLLQSVLKGLSPNIVSIYCYSTSTIALYGIKNNKEWKIWLQNCVDIINKVVKPDNCHYVLSSHNPADITTRECLPNPIDENKFSLFGPQFLLRNKAPWLENKFDSDVTDELRSDVTVNVEFILLINQKN